MSHKGGKPIPSPVSRSSATLKLSPSGKTFQPPRRVPLHAATHIQCALHSKAVLSQRLHDSLSPDCLPNFRVFRYPGGSRQLQPGAGASTGASCRAAKTLRSCRPGRRYAGFSAWRRAHKLVAPGRLVFALAKHGAGRAYLLLVCVALGSMVIISLRGAWVVLLENVFQ